MEVKVISDASAEIKALINEWEPRLLSLNEQIIAERVNVQNRSIRQITGHMVDSATNNTHRVVHLQYQPSPLVFPNYATEGNNDRWIAIQNYQEESWYDLVQLWKYSMFHFSHVIQNVREDKLDNEWMASPLKKISLRQMILDFLPHMKLHLSEIEELM
jgi:hypothetical protein